MNVAWRNDEKRLEKSNKQLRARPIRRYLLVEQHYRMAASAPEKNERQRSLPPRLVVLAAPVAAEPAIEAFVDAVAAAAPGIPDAVP